VLSGRSLPLTDTAHPVAVVTADPNKGTANDVYVPPGNGQLVQIAGGTPTAVTGEAMWYIADTGVRYGLVTNPQDPKEDPRVALGITARPLPTPWSIVSLLPAGPALSKADTLIRMTHYRWIPIQGLYLPMPRWLVPRGWPLKCIGAE
jgi:hypothetical protein